MEQSNPVVSDTSNTPPLPASKPKRKTPSMAHKLSGNVTLSTFPPALISFMRARFEEGASTKQLMQEFGVSINTVTAVKKTALYSRQHVNGLKKGLGDAFAVVASTSMSAITPDKLNSCSAPQLMTVAGIAYDKMRLAHGESTQNISFKSAGESAVEQAEAADTLLKSIIGSLDSEVIGEVLELPEPKEEDNVQS